MNRLHPHLIFALMAIGYAGLPVFFPLIPAVDVIPLSDIMSFAPTLSSGLLYAAWVCAQFWLTWRASHLETVAAWPLRRFIWLTVLFGAPLLLTYPINATDIYRYWFTGRLQVHYGVNPLATPRNAFPDDPYLPFGGEWASETSPYGPLWELLSAGLYRLGDAALLPGLLLFKALGLLLFVASGWVIWQLLANSPVRRSHTALWLWNPALLLMFVADAHNDVLLLLLLLSGLWSVRRSRPVAGICLAVAGVLVKPIGLLALPFVGLEALRGAETWRRRLIIVGAAAIGAMLLTTLAFIPLGSPWPLIERLGRESRAGGGYSPLVFVVLLLRLQSRLDIPTTWLTQTGSISLILLAMWLAWMALRGRNTERSIAELFTGYQLTAFRFRIWYPTWIWPWLLLDTPRRARLIAGWTFLLTAQLAPVVYGHLRLALFDGRIETTHFVGVPFVFGVPLLVWWWQARHNR